MVVAGLLLDYWLGSRAWGMLGTALKTVFVIQVLRFARWGRGVQLVQVVVMILNSDCQRVHLRTADQKAVVGWGYAGYDHWTMNLACLQDMKANLMTTPVYLTKIPAY